MKANARFGSELAAALCVAAVALAVKAEVVSSKDATEPWFGKPIPESGEKPGVADCGMSAAKVFDALDRGNLLPSGILPAASRPIPPATPRRLRSCWQWCHDRCRRSAHQSGFMRDAARCATGRRRFGRTRAPRFPRCGKSTYARVR